MLCGDPMKECVWTLCFRVPNSFWLLSLAFSLLEVTVRTKFLVRAAEMQVNRKERGLSRLWLWGYFSTKGSHGKFCPRLTNISTMCLGEVPEFELLGVEVCEARRQIYRLQIICYSFSISYKWLSETKFSIPHWAFKNKNRTLQRANTFHCKRAQAGNEPFLKNSLMGSGKVAVQGDWRLV